MFYTWKMTLVSLVSVPMVIAAVVLEGRIIAAGIEAVRKASDRANTIATEAITNIRTVAAFCKYITTTYGSLFVLCIKRCYLIFINGEKACNKKYAEGPFL